MTTRYLHRFSILSLILLMGQFAGAQTSAGLSFKRLFMDYQTLNGGDFGAFKDYRNGWEVGVHLPLTEKLLINVPIKVGLGAKTSEFTHEHILGLDAQAHYYFLNAPDRFKPYLLAGGGFVWQGKDSINIQVPAGIGVDIKLTEQAYFNLQSEFRWSSADNNNNFHHGIGFKYFFGAPAEETPELADTDQDGIPDLDDACPLVAGLAEYDGCPDTDGDQIPDPQDECPDVFGVMAFNGCPDTDLDGVPDHQDACPNDPGPLSNNGCPVEEQPDADGDGIPDAEDRCPDVAGLEAFGGCPDRDGDGIEDRFDDCPDVPGLTAFAGCPDTDGDGIPDPKDACPNTAGPASNSGCPVIEKADREVLTFAMRAVQFELGKATLKPDSYSILNQIVNILKKYPDYHLIIEGHTDNTGSADVNQRLSESRAKSCYDYLVQKGISANRLAYKGFGPSRPVADNSTYSGRTLNRRVEFNMVPPK